MKNEIVTEISAVDKVSSVVSTITRSVGSLSDTCGDAVRRIASASERSSGLLAEIARNTRTRWAEMATGVNQALAVAQRAAAVLGGAWRDVAVFGDVAQRLAPVVGGLDRARELADALRGEAANGTESFERLASVAQRLTSVFSDVDSVKRWTSAFHNLAAGTGLDVDELVGNFVRSRASGRFEAGFLDMFAQKGVNVYAPLARELGMAEAELRKAAAAGTLAFGEVEKAILACAEGTGVFAGQAEAMSSTVGGSVRTLAANWRIAAAKFAEPVAEALLPLVRMLSDFAVKAGEVAGALGGVFGGIAGVIADAVASPVGKFAALGAAVLHFLPLMKRAGSDLLLFGRMMRISVTAPLRSFAMQVRATHGSLRAFAGGVLTLNRSMLATCRILRFVFPTAMRVAKAAIASTVIGAAFVVVGEAIAWGYEKLMNFVDASSKAKDGADALAFSVSRLGSEFAGASAGDIRRIEAERLAESVEALEVVADSCGKTLEELYAAESRFAVGQFDAGEYGDEGESLRKIFEARAEIRRAAAEAEKNEIERAAAEKRAARLKAEAEELEQMRAHADALRAEIERRRGEAARDAAETVYSKIQLELSIAGVDSLEALDGELSALESAAALTEEQKNHAERLLSAREKIAALEAAAETQRGALREKIALMQAELEGSEKLLALKEKLHEAEIREQFVKAGYSYAEAEEGVRRYRELEKAVEAKRAAEKQAEKDAEAQELLARESEELAILRAKISGNEALAESLERERAVREKIAELTARGVSAEQARALAVERVALDALRRGKASAGSGRTGAAALPVAVPEARSEAERQALSSAYRAARAGGRTHEQSIAAALAQVRGGDALAGGRFSPAAGGVVPAAGESVLSAVRDIREHTRGILDVLRGGMMPQKVLVNPVLG